MNRDDKFGGEFPKTLFRFFDKELYALQFVKEGKVRVGSLGYYRKIECEARKDPTEASAHYRKPGIVTSALASRDSNEETFWVKDEGVQDYKREWLSSTFLLCCSKSLDNSSCLKQKFGSFVVKIHEPERLAYDLAAMINYSFEGRDFCFSVEGKSVEYNRGGIVTDDRTDHELLSLAYSQKEPRFSLENEFRICLMTSSGLRDDHVDVNIGRELDYVEFL